MVTQPVFTGDMDEAHLPEEGPAEYLYELALQGQGRLHPINPWMMDGNPVEELAAFDPVQYALRFLHRSTRR